MTSHFNEGAHTTQWIPVKSLSIVWASAQRTFDKRHAQGIADNFDPDMYGTLAVTLPNGEGVHHIIDGQHRVVAVRNLWGDEEAVPCYVFDAHDPARAAEIFDQMNTARKPPKRVDIFRIRVTAGAEVEVAVNDIVESFGYHVSSNTSEKTSISAVAALVHVYRAFGSEILKDTLRLLQATWGMDRNAVQANLIRGFGAFLAEYGNTANRSRLAERVAQDYTPGRFMGSVRSAREHFRCDSPRAVKHVLLITYNLGLRTGKIGKPGDLRI